MIVPGYNHFGGRHGELAAIRHLMTFAGVVHPVTGEPLSEALCFGIAGGIGAGYSFCPSVPRWGVGSGVSVVGRHKAYATDAAWYQGFADRIGATTRITETTGTGKAHQHLLDELRDGRPAVVWCSRGQLSFLHQSLEFGNYWMHSFVIYGVDEAAGVAYGAECAPTPVTLPLETLAGARSGICSHRNRTLTLEPPPGLSPGMLAEAALAGLRACAAELLEPRIKTFSLPGLELWAKMITNVSNKDGWLRVFPGRFMYDALRDVFYTIETVGTGGGLYRVIFAEFLDEAADLTEKPALADLAAEYRDLAGRWTALAEAALPERVPPFRQTRELLREKRRLWEEEGVPADGRIAAAAATLECLTQEMRGAFPLGEGETTALLEDLRERIKALHQAEGKAIGRLRDVVG